jgi:hypothetical protein
MIAIGEPLLQRILSEPADESSLALTCARRLSHFARYHFNPNSQKSWDTADKLWRAAILARDVERVPHETNDLQRS